MDRTLVIGLLRALADHTDLDLSAASTDWDGVISTFDSKTEEDMVRALRDAGIPPPRRHTSAYR